MTALHHFHSLPKVEPGYAYKHPRTLREAYPGHDNYDLYVRYEPMHRNDKIVIAGSVVALWLAVVLRFAGVV